MTVEEAVQDAGVGERLQKFQKQLAAAKAKADTGKSGYILPAFSFRPGPLVPGRCRMCGDETPGQAWGCCWRCAVAWRITVGITDLSMIARPSSVTVTDLLL